MASFLSAAEMTPAAQQLFDDDRDELGFVMNASALWAYQPDTMTGIFDLLRQCKAAGDLSQRQMGILVTATASELGDSYCSLSWGTKLADEADAATAAAVLTGEHNGLAAAEVALAEWARTVVRDPNATTDAEVQTLRDAGFTDDQIFAITVVVALRLAFSTINDALGAAPDGGLRAIVPEQVLDAVTFGRPIAD